MNDTQGVVSMMSSCQICHIRGDANSAIYDLLKVIVKRFINKVWMEYTYIFMINMLYFHWVVLPVRPLKKNVTRKSVITKTLDGPIELLIFILWNKVNFVRLKKKKTIIITNVLDPYFINWSSLIFSLILFWSQIYCLEK